MKNNLKEILQFKNQTANSADLYIYGDIVCDSWSKWQDEDKYPMEVKNFLDEVKGKELNIYINSGGGSVFAGMAIYNMLKRHEGKKTVYIDGLAGSISSIIALAGDEIIMPSNAYFMIHKPWALIAGNSDDLIKLADNLEKIEDGMISIYMENAKKGVSEQAIRDLLKAETWFSGDKINEIFDFEVIEELKAVAFIGEYANFCKNTPIIKTKNMQNKNIEKRKCDTKLRLLSLKGATK